MKANNFKENITTQKCLLTHIKSILASASTAHTWHASADMNKFKHNILKNGYTIEMIPVYQLVEHKLKNIFPNFTI